MRCTTSRRVVVFEVDDFARRPRDRCRSPTEIYLICRPLNRDDDYRREKLLWNRNVHRGLRRYGCAAGVRRKTLPSFHEPT